jgi:hypothetical protein
MTKVIMGGDRGDGFDLLPARLDPQFVETAVTPTRSPVKARGWENKRSSRPTD